MILIRGFKPETDKNFVYNSWLKSYAQAPSVVSMPKTLYFKQFHKIITTLMQTSKISVLCDKTDHEHIYGYSVTEDSDNTKIVHFVYVKAPYRRNKLAENLLANQGVATAKHVVYTHFTPVVRNLISKYSSTEFNPFLLQGLYEKASDNK